jgi:uncharacterized HAD superfamily protein
MEINEEKIKIGVDIDDVIFPFMANFLKYINGKNNTSYSFKDITSYYLWKMGIHKSKEEDIIVALEFQNSLCFGELGLIEGAKEVIDKISEEYMVHFVTSRPEVVKDKTTKLLNKYFPRNGFKVFYSGDVYGKNLSKTEICKENNISIIIEDNQDYAYDLAKNGIKVFLLDKPWNKDYVKHENIIKVNKLEDVLELLK